MKTRLLLVMIALLTLATGVKADDAFVVWDETNTTLYFSYGTVPTEGGSWTNEAKTDVTATKVWSGTDVTETGDDTPYWVSYVQSTCKKVIFEKSFVNVKPTSCNSWFCNFENLTSIEGLANLDTSEVTDMSYMFQEYQGIYLDLTGFDTSKVTDMEQMFAACTSVKAIVIGDKWITTEVKVSDNMFFTCYALVGEDGTTFDWADNDVRKAHAGTGGYLTKKTVSIAANTVGSDNWATYYKSNVNRVADANTTVYIATAAGDKLTLTAVADKNIKAGQAVILKSTAATITLTSTTDEATADFSANELIGTDVAMTAPANTYVLGNGTSGVGFYKYTGTLAANKAYITIAAGSRDFYAFDNVTAIKSVRDNTQKDATYYDLNGRQVQNPTKGLYIVNGKKVIIK